jgi:Fe-S oxidoreductase
MNMEVQVASPPLSREHHILRCIQCGKCTGGCPVSTNSILNVRRLLNEMILLPSLTFSPEESELWQCTTCMTCSQRCPKGIKPLDVIIEIRGQLIESGRIQPALRDALESTFLHGNPWGKPREKRSDWAAGLKVEEAAPGQDLDLVYYVGCTVAYDPRLQKLAQDMVRVLDAAGVKFGILGTEESCCGNEIRRMGELGLFEELVESNQKLFQERGVDRLMTTSPHCYNVFKNEYPEFDGEVMHYSQVLKDLLADERLPLSRELGWRVTYHDPCFLGKQNAIFDPPREVLSRVPGLEFVELDRSRERSLCCEGGGGRMWTEDVAGQERLAEIRVRDAVDLGARVLVTACPFCLLTLEDAVKTCGQEESIRVLDLIEVVAAAL